MNRIATLRLKGWNVDTTIIVEDNGAGSRTLRGMDRPSPFGSFQISGSPLTAGPTLTVGGITITAEDAQ